MTLGHRDLFVEQTESFKAVVLDGVMADAVRSVLHLIVTNTSR